MSWWKQVRCELAPQQQQHMTAAGNNNSNDGVLADMNGTNGNCSCHKQRRCNRLTSYRNGNSSGSNHPRALPLFITVAVLVLAMTPINAAVIKRSIAETSTNLNSTTPNSPLATIDENDSTTVNIPLLANTQSTAENVQHNAAITATALHEPETTTISSSTVGHDDQVMNLDAPQDVNNEIAQVVSEEAATDFYVKTNPKFDYAETVLDENLEDSIRNSVRNEIEFEQDIVAGEVPHIEILTDQELRQKLANEVLLIQRSFQEGSNSSHAPIEALAQLKSLLEQLSTTESTTFEHSKTVDNGLLVLKPLQTQETVSPNKSLTDNQQDIGAAEVQPLEKLTDEELRQRLANEVLLIQRWFQEGDNKSSAAVEALAKLQSLLEQMSTTESTRYEYSKTVDNDLSVLFPLQTEGTVSPNKSFADNQRGARNLNNENEEILNANSETNVHFNEDNGMQNIEEEKIKAQEESLDADKSLLQTFSRISESALYSHEANEIDEEGSALQKGSIGAQEHELEEEETNFEDRNISASTEKQLVSSEENNLRIEGIDPSVVASAEGHETALSSASNEIVVGMQDKPSVQDETAEKNYPPIAPNETEISSAATDEASLSLLLDENITATETTTALAEDVPLDLLHLDESDALVAEEAPTTLEPDSVKSVHTVIKKQGVELLEDLFEPASAETVEETTASIDIVKEEMFEDEKVTAKPTETLVNDVDIEREQSIQNDDAENETSLQLDDKVDDQTVSESIGAITGQVIEETTQTNNDGDKLSDDINQIAAENVEGSGQKDEEVDSSSAISDDSIQFNENQDALNDNKFLEEINNDIGSQTEKSTATENVQSANVESPTVDIIQEAEEDNEITQVSSTTKSMTNEHNSQSSATTEQSGQKHISLLSTTHLSSAEVPHTNTNTVERQSTTPKEFEVTDEDDNNTNDRGIVPLLVGVSTGEGDVTASTKGSRSINTQTHHTMLLTQLDDTMAATLFETFPPHNAGRTLNDHMAAESSGGIGKPLPARSINEATSASIFSRSGLIIVVCSSIAFMFLLVSVAAFLISFHRQHGTLDIEMQEQRCGKDDLDEEDEEAGTCTKLLEIELPKSTIVTASCEELEECL